MFELILANGFVALATFVQAAVGIGFAMIAVPLLVLIDLDYAPAPSLVIMLMLSLFMVCNGWRDVLRDGLPALMPGLLIGTVLGASLLGLLSDQTFGLVFGFIVLIGVGLSLLGTLPPPSAGQFAVGGLMAGAMGTISGIHGPPLVVLYQRATPAQARATIALIFTIATCLSLGTLYYHGQADATDISRAVPLIPGLAIGLAAALSGRQILPASIARRLMLTLAALSALSLIAKSILGS